MNTSQKHESLIENLKEIISDRKEKIMALDEKITALQKRRNSLVKDIETSIASIKAFSNSKDFVEFVIEEASHVLRSNMGIGDAIEAIIKADGSQFQRDLIAKIRNVGIKISDNSPYVVIGNAIRRDKRKRFKRLEDGRVALRTEKERADAKS